MDAPIKEAYKTREQNRRSASGGARKIVAREKASIKHGRPKRKFSLLQRGGKLEETDKGRVSGRSKTGGGGPHKQKQKKGRDRIAPPPGGTHSGTRRQPKGAWPGASTSVGSDGGLFKGRTIVRSG